MSTSSIITSLEKLITLYQGINSLAKRKTEIIKKNDTDALSKLLIDEQKQLKAIEQTDKEREHAVKTFLHSKNAPITTTTLTDLSAWADESESRQLETLKNKLLFEVSSLKQENQLNQQLIYQSLQFINVSLDMFRPAQQDFNYEKPVHQPSNRGSRSMFDSQA